MLAGLLLGARPAFGLGHPAVELLDPEPFTRPVRRQGGGQLGGELGSEVGGLTAGEPAAEHLHRRPGGAFGVLVIEAGGRGHC